MIISETQSHPHRSFHCGALMRVAFGALLTIVALTNPLSGESIQQDSHRLDQPSPATQFVVWDRDKEPERRKPEAEARREAEEAERREVEIAAKRRAEAEAKAASDKKNAAETGAAKDDEPENKPPDKEPLSQKAADETTEGDMKLSAEGRERVAIVCTIILLVLIFTTVYAFLRDFVPGKDDENDTGKLFWYRILHRGILFVGVLVFLIILVSLAWWLTAPLKMPTATTVPDKAATASSTSKCVDWFGCIKLCVTPRKNWFEDITLSELTLLIVSAFGPLGGVLYTMLDDKLTLPHYDQKKGEVQLGYLVDCAYGFGGAIAVFVVVPGELDPSEKLMKVIGTVFVAGYGGRALIAKAFGQLLNRINEVQDTFDKEDKALTLSREQVEGKKVSADELNKAILEASPICRTTIFNEVKQTLQKYSELSSERVLQTLPILQALVESDEQGKQHRYHAALGLALLKGKNTPKEAQDSFTEAIKIRTKVKSDADGTYEFGRALCRISLLPDKDENDATRNDLIEAAKDPFVRQRFKDNKGIDGTDAKAVAAWLKKVKILPKDVGLA